MILNKELGCEVSSRFPVPDSEQKNRTEHNFIFTQILHVHKINECTNQSVFNIIKRTHDMALILDKNDIFLIDKIYEVAEPNIVLKNKIHDNCL